jgi:hypothetical protein
LSLFIKKRKNKVSKGSQDKNNYGGFGGLILHRLLHDWFFLGFRGAGGGKCPEEEHTTCSGGPTINCHKRGLRGEILFYIK